MVRTNFGGNQFRLGRDERNFVCGRNVQNVEAMIVAHCKVNCASGCNLSRFMIAYPRVIGYIRTVSIPFLVRLDGSFVLAMRGDSKSCLREDSLQCLLLIDQQVACTRPDKNLDSGRTCRRLQELDVLLQVIRVGRIKQRLRCGRGDLTRRGRGDRKW